MEAQSLAEFRDNIDRLDRHIVRLMAERGSFVEQAARFKASHAEVDAPRRRGRGKGAVDGVGGRSRARCRRSRVSAMITAFIAVEHLIFERHRKA